MDFFSTGDFALLLLFNCNTLNNYYNYCLTSKAWKSTIQKHRDMLLDRYIDYGGFRTIEEYYHQQILTNGVLHGKISHPHIYIRWFLGKLVNRPVIYYGSITNNMVQHSLDCDLRDTKGGRLVIYSSSYIAHKYRVFKLYIGIHENSLIEQCLYELYIQQHMVKKDGKYVFPPMVMIKVLDFYLYSTNGSAFRLGTFNKASTRNAVNIKIKNMDFVKPYYPILSA